MCCASMLRALLSQIWSVLECTKKAYKPVEVVKLIPAATRVARPGFAERLWIISMVGKSPANCIDAPSGAPPAFSARRPPVMGRCMKLGRLAPA